MLYTAFIYALSMLYPCFILPIPYHPYPDALTSPIVKESLMFFYNRLSLGLPVNTSYLCGGKSTEYAKKSIKPNLYGIDDCATLSLWRSCTYRNSN